MHGVDQDILISFIEGVKADAQNQIASGGHLDLANMAAPMSTGVLGSDVLG